MHVDAKITSKNQITLPREVRERLGVKAGDRLRYDIGDDGRIAVRKVTASFESLRGIVDLGRDVSTDEIVTAVHDMREQIGLEGRNGTPSDGEP